MKPFRPYKARKPGTLYAALTAAINQAGGLSEAADLLGRSDKRMQEASDPDADQRRASELTYAEARTLSRQEGVYALAEDLALLAGGVFLPPPPSMAPCELQQALATYSSESGEAVAEVVRAVMDGKFTSDDAVKVLPEIDDALRALMLVRSIAVGAAEGA